MLRSVNQLVSAPGVAAIAWRRALAWLTNAMAVVTVALPGACSRPVDPARLRVGYFPNVTHAPALTGVESGRFAQALAPVRLEPTTFTAGPSAMGALLGGAIDVAYLGPNPALAGYLRSRGEAVRVVSGVASGGALFVVRPDAGIRRPEDLRGKRLATPQLGNTQDVALRSFLAAHALVPREHGGDVTVLPLSNPDILAQFQLGHLDGAWVPEPWASRLVIEAGGKVFLDERDLWPGGASRARCWSCVWTTCAARASMSNVSLPPTRPKSIGCGLIPTKAAN